MELKYPLKLTDQDKERICLPDNNKRIPDLYECNIVGWGHTTFNGKQPESLHEATVLTIPNSVCNLPIAYNNTIPEKELLCAGYEKGGVDACNFDSGGAMVCKTKGKYQN